MPKSAENPVEILTRSLNGLADEEIVAINASVARQINLEVAEDAPDNRPVAFSVSEIRAQLATPVPVSTRSPATDPAAQEQIDDGADL